MTDFVLKQTASEVQKAIDNALNPDTTLTVSGKPADAKAVGDALANIGGGLSSTEKNLVLSLFKNAAYTTNMSATIAQLETLWSGGNVPDEPEVTLVRISATYSGGSVPVGTAVSALTGIKVTAHYSDGSTATVTGYTLSGTIREGSNTITVSYGGKTATFTVVGEAVDTEADVSQVGKVLIVKSGVTVTKNGNVLNIA